MLERTAAGEVGRLRIGASSPFPSKVPGCCGREIGEVAGRLAAIPFRRLLVSSNRPGATRKRLQHCSCQFTPNNSTTVQRTGRPDPSHDAAIVILPIFQEFGRSEGRTLPVVKDMARKSPVTMTITMSNGVRTRLSGHDQAYR